MADLHYPGLYVAADQASNDAQRYELLCYKINAALLVVGASLALVSTVTTPVAIVSAMFFIASLGTYLYSHHKDFKGRWYQARALAESIKTSTWRLVMNADPFSDQDANANIQKYQRLLSELLKENSVLGILLATDAALKEQFPIELTNVIKMSYSEKRSFYLKNRIDEQKTWYAKKAKENRTKASRYLFAITAAYSAAIILLLVRIGYPDLSLLPIDVFAVVASSLIGWKQLRRFDELSSSYGLTAHEVGIIGLRFSEVSSQNQLSNFVSDAENAFSREHTQWAARRDH
jgi:hypothetical protein